MIWSLLENISMQEWGIYPLSKHSFKKISLKSEHTGVGLNRYFLVILLLFAFFLMKHIADICRYFCPRYLQKKFYFFLLSDFFFILSLILNNFLTALSDLAYLESKISLDITIVLCFQLSIAEIYFLQSNIT